MNWLRRMSWKKRIGLTLGSFFLLFVVLFGVAYALTSVPTPSKIATAQSTRILYADGTTMGSIGTNRQTVALTQISIAAQQAVLAAEDRGFYSEPGISPKGIARALFTNVKSGGVTQGGSTITQQYAKNAFLTQNRTFSRKIKEVFIALKMSQTVSKSTILEDYLNTIYFGRGAYGIQAASETYFGVPASALSVSQSAVLASSIRSPSGYDPAKHLALATERWNYVLDGMVKQKWLTPADRAAERYPSVLKVSTKNFPGPLDHVRMQVVDELQAHGFTEERISAGGLIVHTTIQKVAQTAAQAAVESLIPTPTPSTSNPVVGALVAVQPGTGKVIAYYGGRDAGGYDYANGGPGVQPGSSMKPYVLATALKQGISLSTTFNGASHQNICGQKDVKNDSGDPPFGQIDLATALQHSVNTVYVRLACQVGPKNVVETAHAAGLPTSDKLDGDTGTPTQQIALGSGGYEIHVLDQADGYATFAANGTQATPYFVQKVTDLSNNEVYSAKPRTTQAFSAGIAADVLSAMEKVVSGGTGTRAQLAGGRPTAGKTGTTTDNLNAWFAGVTPQLSAAVWLGNQKGGKLTIPGTNDGVYGGTLPAKIFKSFMDAALAGQANQDFPGAANVGATPTPTATPSATATATPTATPTSTGHPSPTPSPTPQLSVPPLLPSTPPPTATPTATPSRAPTAAPLASP